MTLLTSVDLASRCAGDGEFQLAARYWTDGLRLEVGDDLLAMRLVDGVPSPGDPGAGDGVITLGGPVELWRDMLAPIPPRFANDVSPATALGLRRTGDGLLWWQYVPAIQRAIELLRDAPDTWSGTVDESGPTPRLDAPVGRYLHLDLDRHDHRVYFEEAGQGIPLLLQHTAGSHGVQWRHLFECGEITDHFRLIAYDLPFHGKSIPPVTRRWWEQQYRLTGSFLRQVPSRSPRRSSSTGRCSWGALSAGSSRSISRCTTPIGSGPSCPSKARWTSRTTGPPSPGSGTRR